MIFDPVTDLLPPAPRPAFVAPAPTCGFRACRYNVSGAPDEASLVDPPLGPDMPPVVASPVVVGAIFSFEDRFV
jgi:hypothetical protein